MPSSALRQKAPSVLSHRDHSYLSPATLSHTTCLLQPRDNTSRHLVCPQPRWGMNAEHRFAGELAVINSSRCPYKLGEKQPHPHGALRLQSTRGRQPGHPWHGTHCSPPRAAPLSQPSWNQFQPAPQPRAGDEPTAGHWGGPQTLTLSALCGKVLVNLGKVKQQTEAKVPARVIWESRNKGKDLPKNLCPCPKRLRTCLLFFQGITTNSFLWF